MGKTPIASKDAALVPPAERAAAAIKQLQNKSKELAEITKGLDAELRKVESILLPLNLVSAWCAIASGHDYDSGHWWSRDIGLTVLGNSHRIALRSRSGDDDPEHESNEVWRFAEAPHWMQIESVNKLPELFEVLLERVESTIKKLNAKKTETTEFVSALSSLLAADKA